tara:strand:- start:2115 stop:2321 length:207 start_codon:yes stop_codon:yes gene_type:complete
MEISKELWEKFRWLEENGNFRPIKNRLLNDVPNRSFKEKYFDGNGISREEWKYIVDNYDTLKTKYEEK